MREAYYNPLKAEKHPCTVFKIKPNFCSSKYELALPPQLSAPMLT